MMRNTSTNAWNDDMRLKGQTSRLQKVVSDNSQNLAVNAPLNLKQHVLNQTSSYFKPSPPSQVLINDTLTTAPLGQDAFY